MRTLPVLLLAIALTGCFGSGGPEEAVADDPPTGSSMAYAPINESALAPAIHAVGARHTDYIPAADEINLFIEWWLPDDDPGPWPTILHSTPYSHLDRPLGGIGYRDVYVPKGYAVAVTDVRGFGESEGCVTVWGPQEQDDQVAVVEWIAQQPWSDGQVGMIGVSYPGTTPIEAAVMAPQHLTTVVAIAGLTDPYFDWHYGGVPNSEPSGSPAAYFGIGAAPPQEVTGGPNWLGASAHGRCVDPPVVTESYRTDGLYTDYYAVRNFSARADNIQVPFLYSEGFVDGNVKPSQLLNFFNAIPTPKKGFFGHWGHSNPAREDWRMFEQAWFDHWMKGLPTGVMDGPTVEVITNLDTWRADTHFPPQVQRRAAWLDACVMAIVWNEPTMECSADLQATTTEPVPLDTGEIVLRFLSEPAPEDVLISGEPKLHFDATIDAENAFFAGDLYFGTEQSPRISFGALNAKLRDGYTELKDVPQGEAVGYRMPFQPTEWILLEGERMELWFSIDNAIFSTNPEGQAQVHATLHTGPGSSHLSFPVLPQRTDTPLPWQQEAQ